MVEQLGGIDAAFIGLETATAHLQGVGVVRLDPAAAPLGRDELIELVGRRLPHLDLLRRRLVTVPGGLDRPYWAETPPDLEHHITAIRLARDDPAALERLCGEIASVPLDRTRPLWAFWLVDGLPDGGQALVIKVHHALCDGIGSLALIAQLFDTDPDAVTVTGPVPEPVPVEDDPGAPWLLARAAGHGLGRAVDVVTTSVRVLGSLGRLRRAVATVTGRDGTPAAAVEHGAGNGGTGGTASAERGAAGDDTGEDSGDAAPGERDLAVAAPLATPHLPFHGPVTAARSAAFRDLPLDRVKAVAHASGTHVNDVILAVLAGALRRWLADQGALPDQALVAAVPVSTRSPEQLLEPGNHVSACFVHLPVHLGDPRQRLLVTAGVADRGKALHAAVGQQTLAQLGELAVPFLLQGPADLYRRSGLAARHPAPVNLVVSNVAGPPFALYLAGRPAAAFYALGPIFDGVALNITAISFHGVLGVGYLTCPDRLADVEVLADGQQAAFDELADAYGC